MPSLLPPVPFVLGTNIPGNPPTPFLPTFTIAPVKILSPSALRLSLLKFFAFLTVFAAVNNVPSPKVPPVISPSTLDAPSSMPPPPNKLPTPPPATLNGLGVLS